MTKKIQAIKKKYKNKEIIHVYQETKKNKQPHNSVQQKREMRLYGEQCRQIIEMVNALKLCRMEISQKNLLEIECWEDAGIRTLKVKAPLVRLTFEGLHSSAN